MVFATTENAFSFHTVEYEILKDKISYCCFTFASLKPIITKDIASKNVV